MPISSPNKSIIQLDDPALVKISKPVATRLPLTSTVKVTGTPDTNQSRSSLSGQSSDGRVTDITSTTTFNSDKTLYVTNVSQSTNNLFYDSSQDVTMYDKLYPITGATAVVTHDVSLSHVFYHTNVVANFTVNAINIGLNNLYSTNIILIINQGATPYIANGFRIEGITKTINWQAGSIPTGNANKKDLISFTVTYVDGNYTVLGQLVSFG